MSRERNTYTESFKIRSSEVRPDGKAKLQTLCDLFQEIAGNHALRLNFDVTHLQEQQLTWVLHRLHIRVKRYPQWRDEVTITTWPSGGDRLRAYRDFRLLDNRGESIGEAVSYWMMIDLEKRRPVRMPQEVLAMSPESNEHVLPLDRTRPTSPEHPEQRKLFEIRHSDLDVNGHVNNVAYVEWITEVLPANLTVNEIDIEYKAETGYGERIAAVSGPMDGNGTIRAEIRQAGKEQVLATAELQVDESSGMP